MTGEIETDGADACDKLLGGDVDRGDPGRQRRGGVTPISPLKVVPVLLTPSDEMDACPSTVRPKLPRGGADGFLSLRAGPGTA